MIITEPKIDAAKIQEAANNAAEAAFIKEVEAYYSGYDSPYKKAIKAELEKQEMKWNLELPNIMGLVNQALTDEVDSIANNAIAQSYIPMVSDSLTSIEKKQTMSNLLKTLIADIEPNEEEQEDFDFSYSKKEQYDWLDCELTTDKGQYEFTLHKFRGEDDVYRLLSLPSETGYSRVPNKTMTIWANEVKIEMPFTPNILRDKVINLFFKMMLSQCEITMDCNSIDEDWFPRDECHC